MATLETASAQDDLPKKAAAEKHRRYGPYWKYGRRWLPILAVSAAFLHNLSHTWLKWGDLIVDNGQGLEVARRLAGGEVLYRDLRYYYGPLAPYLNALWFRLFGVRTGVLMAAGLCTAALMSVLLYRLGRCFMGRLGATVAAVAFLYLCAFGHYTPNGTFNFVLPYTFSATYGLLAATASLFFLVRHARKHGPRDFFLAAFFLVLTALTKLEILFALGLTHLVFAAGAHWERGERRLAWLPHALGYAGALLGAAAVYGLLAAQTGFASIADNLFAIFNARFTIFTQEHLGLRNWPRSLQALLFSALLLGGVILLLRMLGRWARPKSQLRHKTTRLGLGLGLLALGGGGGAYAGLLAKPLGLRALFVNPALELPFRVLPLLALGIWMVLAWRFVRKREERPDTLSHLLPWTFGGAMLGRMALHSVAFHFGFFLLPVGLLGFAVFWFRYLPALGNAAGHGAGPWRWGGVGVFLGLVAAHFSASALVYARRSERVQTPRGTIYILDAYRGRPVGRYQRAAVSILSRLPPKTRVLAVPEGAGLLFFSGLPLPYGMYHFLPTDMVGAYADERLLARLRAAPPDVILRVAYDLSEFSARGFGVDYAPRCGAWIKAHYRPWLGIGRRPFDYILFLKRKGAPDPLRAGKAPAQTR